MGLPLLAHATNSGIASDRVHRARNQEPPTYNGVRRGTKLLKEQHGPPTELHRAEGAVEFHRREAQWALMLHLNNGPSFAQSGRVQLWRTSVGRLIYRHRQYCPAQSLPHFQDFQTFSNGVAFVVVLLLLFDACCFVVRDCFQGG